MTQTLEQKMAFAVAPDGTGDGIPLILMGIPTGAWEYMKDGHTHTFDLTKAGIPAKFILFGGKDHDEVMKMMTTDLAKLGIVVDDQRRKDFSIKNKDEKDGS